MRWGILNYLAPPMDATSFLKEVEIVRLRPRAQVCNKSAHYTVTDLDGRQEIVNVPRYENQLIARLRNLAEATRGLSDALRGESGAR